MWIPGGTYFFTVVTYNRLPILTLPECRKLLRHAWRDVNHRFPFTTNAICLLPDHLHCIWTLPDDDADFAIRWKEIKRLFTREYTRTIGFGDKRNVSRTRRGEAAIWQRRFWEHTIRDEVDLERHIDYIHFNPVKHGLVGKVADWPWSSYFRYVRSGYYVQNLEDKIPDEVAGLLCGE